MDEKESDMSRELVLDGNSVGGLLMEVFSTEMTAAPAECASCGNVAPLGALLALTQAPGLVLRCPACEGVILRIVQTDSWIYLDARGASCIRMKRPAP
jgi:Family of unknown function (DUF6510)